MTKVTIRLVMKEPRADVPPPRARRKARKPAARLAGALGRALLAVVATALTLALLVLLGLGALAWRLADGPLPLDALLRRAQVLPGGTSAGTVSLAWAGWRGGPSEPVRVRVQGLSMASLPGVAALRLDDGEAALALAPLLRGSIAPVSIQVAGLDARLSPAGGGGTELPAQLDLGALRTVSVRDARVAIPSSGTDWSAQVAAAEVRQDPSGAASGDVAGTLLANGASVPVQARLTRAPDGALHVEAKAGEFSPAALATKAPMLSGLAALDAPVSLTASADLSAAFRPVRAAVQVTVGTGTAAVAGGTIPVRDAAGEVALSWRGEELREVALNRLAVVLRSPSGGAPTTLHLAAKAFPAGEGWRVQGRVAFDQVAAADLPQLWPPGAIRNARRWIVENITAGTAHAGRFAATLNVPADPGRTQLAAISGTLQGDDLTIHWLRPVPPVEHGRATLEFVNPDTIRIAVLGGEQGGLRVQGGTILLTGLAPGHDDTLDVALDIAGPLTAAVTLLSHPRLKLLSRRPLPFAVAAGRAAGQVRVRLPLTIAKLEASGFTSKAHARLSDVVLRNVVLGRGLTRGAAELDVNDDGLRLSGQAQVAAIPVRLEVTADFRSGPPSQAQLMVDATGRVTAAALEREGLDARGMLTGAAPVSVRYTLRRDKEGEVAIHADMDEAAVMTPLWRKPGGAPATASARLILRDDRVVAVESLHAKGPGLLVSGRAEMAEGRPAVLDLDRIVLDRTEAAGTIRLPRACGGAVCVRLAGPVLDLSTGLGRIARAQGASKGGLPWRADVRFGRVLLDEGRELGPVRADARSNGKRLVSAALEAPGVQGSLREDGRERVASLRAANLGALLAAVGATDLLHGGRLSFAGRFDDALPGSPLTGTADLEDFSVQRAVVMGKLLQALTVFGILDAIRGPGLAFSRAVVPFRYAGNVLAVQGARAHSASLGVTAKGRLDLARSTVDLHGTIVPAYVVNSALGRLPLIGRLFSPERGGGVIAADFTLRGRLDDPSVMVNPLSALTPGFLRGVFGIFK